MDKGGTRRSDIAGTGSTVVKAGFEGPEGQYSARIQ